MVYLFFLYNDQNNLAPSDTITGLFVALRISKIEKKWGSQGRHEHLPPSHNFEEKLFQKVRITIETDINFYLKRLNLYQRRIFLGQKI